jgi:preprotein translocase subunit SecY
MELGISPTVTASMIMQLVQGTRMIQIDMGVQEDRILFSGAQKGILAKILIPPYILKIYFISFIINNCHF